MEQVGDADAVELGVRPSVATRRTVSPALGCFACNVCSADDDQQPLVARAGEVTVVERVPVAGELQRLLRR